MIILKPTATAQTIKFIARKDYCDLLVLRDENAEVEINGIFTLIGQYMTSSLVFTLTEGKFYNLTAYKTLVSDYVARVESDGGTIESQSCFNNYSTENREVVYKDKIFCTSQTDFSINSGEYIEHTSDNTYITI